MWVVKSGNKMHKSKEDNNSCEPTCIKLLDINTNPQTLCKKANTNSIFQMGSLKFSVGKSIWSSSLSTAALHCDFSDFLVLEPNPRVLQRPLQILSYTPSDSDYDKQENWCWSC